MMAQESPKTMQQPRTCLEAIDAKPTIADIEAFGAGGAAAGVPNNNANNASKSDGNETTTDDDENDVANLYYQGFGAGNESMSSLGTYGGTTTRLMVPSVLDWMRTKVPNPSKSKKSGGPSRKSMSQESCVLHSSTGSGSTMGSAASSREDSQRSRGPRKSMRSKRRAAGIKPRQSHARRSSAARRPDSSLKAQNQKPILQVLEEVASAIKIQSLFRQVRGKETAKKLRMKKQYAHHVKVQEEERKLQEAELAKLEAEIEEELRGMEGDLREIEEQNERDLQQKLAEMETQMLDTIAADQELPEVSVDHELLHLGEVDRMADENKKLQRSKEDVRRKVEAMTEENDKMEAEHAEIKEMFASLNDFAKKKMEENKELAAAQKLMVEEAIPKAKQECEQGSTSCTQEMRVVEVYRRCMYDHLRILQTEGSVEMLEEAAKMIEDCEKQLGNAVGTQLHAGV